MSSGESIFDQLIAGRSRSRTNSSSARDFQVDDDSVSDPYSLNQDPVENFNPDPERP